MWFNEPCEEEHFVGASNDTLRIRRVCTGAITQIP